MKITCEFPSSPANNVAHPMIADHCLTAGDIQPLQHLGLHLSCIRIGLRHNCQAVRALQGGVYRLAPLIQPGDGLGHSRFSLLNQGQQSIIARQNRTQLICQHIT